MTKFEELLNQDSCFNKAHDNERIFVLLSRDPAAPKAIRAWCTERVALGLNSVDDPKLAEAMQCADLMDAERSSTLLEGKS